MTHIICEDPITNTKKLVEHLQRVGVAVCHDQNFRVINSSQECLYSRFPGSIFLLCPIKFYQ